MGSDISEEISRNSLLRDAWPHPTWYTDIQFVPGNPVFYSASSVLLKFLTGFLGIWVSVIVFVCVLFFFHRLSMLKGLLVVHPIYSCSKHLTGLSQVKPIVLHQGCNDSVSPDILMAHHLSLAFSWPPVSPSSSSNRKKKCITLKKKSFSSSFPCINLKVCLVALRAGRVGPKAALWLMQGWRFCTLDTYLFQ